MEVDIINLKKLVHAGSFKRISSSWASLCHIGGNISANPIAIEFGFAQMVGLVFCTRYPPGNIVFVHFKAAWLEQQTNR